MKVLFMVPSLSNGGAERMVCRIASELSNDNDYSVGILYFFDVGNLYPLSNKVHLINLSKGDEVEYGKISKFDRLIRIRKIIEEYDPDYIVPFLDYVCLYAFISTIFTKYNKRIMCTERNKPNINLIRSFVVSHTGNFIVQNIGQKQEYSQKIQDKTIVIPNFIENSFFEKEKVYSNNINHIVAMGRLVEQKNYPLLIRAFSKIESNDIVLHIYGEGHLKTELEQLANSLNIQDRVVFEGRTNDVINTIVKYDLYIMSSDYEGMPNALAEAMALGLPCISTNCKYGPNELITDGVDGILVPTNDVDKMYNAISFMIDNPGEAIKIGSRAKNNICSLLKKDNVINKWKEVFNLKY